MFPHVYDVPHHGPVFEHFAADGSGADEEEPETHSGAPKIFRESQRKVVRGLKGRSMCLVIRLWRHEVLAAYLIRTEALRGTIMGQH